MSSTERDERREQQAHEEPQENQEIQEQQQNVSQEQREEEGTSSKRERTLERKTSAYSLSLSQYMECMEMRESTGYQVYPGTEREDYDFNAERFGVYSTNLIESTAHLVKGCLGAGILSMHEAYMFAGLWTSVIVTIILATIMSHTMMMLVKSAQKMYPLLRLPRLTYPDLLEVAVATGPWKGLRCFSKCFRYAADFFLFFQMCGTCCIYEIMIANTLKGVLEAVSDSLQESNYDVRIYILIITVPLLAICLIRSLKYLAPFAMVADTFVAICVLTTIYYSLKQAQNISDRPAWKSFSGVIRFCGICLYSMDGIGVTLPVENNMERPRYFYVVVAYGMTIVITSITITGFFGYWGWGEECTSPVTIHMPMTDT
ncbi:hypothetical protein O3G_MSEX003190 [Manduca sexta]|nr:hypothetical protein O3G_MSEX003190 [Manduca sexta]